MRTKQGNPMHLLERFSRPGDGNPGADCVRRIVSWPATVPNWLRLSEEMDSIVLDGAGE